MNRINVFLIIIIAYSFVGSNTTYKYLKVGDTLMVTYDEDNGVIDWDRTDSKIVFTSSYTGTNNIYILPLNVIKFENSKDQFHQALHLEKFINKADVYLPITNCKDTTFSQPKWNDKKTILTIASYNNENELFFIHTRTSKIISSNIKNITAADWESNHEIFYVKQGEPKNLYLTNLHSKKDSVFLVSPSDIKGINVQKNDVLLTCSEGVFEYSISKNESNWYPLSITGKNCAKLDDLTFAVKTKTGSASIYDLNNGEETVLMAGEGDHSPNVSNNLKYIAFYSDFMKGIVIKRLK